MLLGFIILLICKDAWRGPVSNSPSPITHAAIKLGLSLTNLTFKECKNDVEDILSINRKYKTPLKELTSNFLKVDSYLRKNAGVYKFDITYCIWDDDIGKGIDDYLDSFKNVKDATKGISKIQLIKFWNLAFNYLKLNEETKEKIKLEQRLEELVHAMLIKSTELVFGWMI